MYINTNTTLLILYVYIYIYICIYIYIMKINDDRDTVWWDDYMKYKKSRYTCISTGGAWRKTKVVLVKVVSLMIQYFPE